MPSGRNDAKALKAPGVATTGIVVRLVRDRGFGFIRIRDGNDEYFFHKSNCYDGAWETINGFKDNQLAAVQVSFEATDTAKGLRAEHVRVLG